MTYYRKINDVEFDHVFTVMSGGTVTDGPSGIVAPESNDGQLSGDGWEYVDGYSGQYSYSGPIMHPSEFLGGRMERDILSSPGIYAVVVDYASPEDGEEDDGDNVSGWAAVRYTGNLPSGGRYIGMWHGGHSYSSGDWTDAEWFTSLSDAADAMRDRERNFRPTFRHVMRANSTDDTPCAHSEYSGSIALYRIIHAMTPEDVQCMIGEGYPDRLVEFGPRGGIRISRT